MTGNGLPDPRHDDKCRTHRYDLPVTTLAFASLAFLVVATVGGAIFATVRGLEAWRTLNSFQRRLEAGTVALVAGLDGVEARIARVSDGAEELDRAGARLRHSLAGFRLLTTAIEDARAAAPHPVLPLLAR